MTWGGFKSRFIGTDHIDEIQHQIQVPVIVHHGQRYISFGSDDPPLCFRYVLQDTERKLAPVMLLQKFIFSLNWMPEKFHENQQNINEFINTGELELF